MGTTAPEIVHDITTLGRTTDIIIPPAPRRGKPTMLSEEEARSLTTTIQHLEVQAWFLLSEAHDRQAWAALGYDSWKEYVTAELQMSEARSYQLLDQAKVMRAIASVDGVDSNALEAPTARVVQKVKDDLQGVRRVVKQALKNDSPIDDALRNLAARRAKTQAEGRKALAAGADDDAEVISISPQTKVECPACAGHGRVTAKKAAAIEAALHA